MGPRLMINGICPLCAVYVLLVMVYFQFCKRNLEKMLYWLKIVEFDTENRCFFRMNLNQFDSKMFVKRILIFVVALKCFTSSFMPLFVLINFLLVFKYVDDYQLNYLVSIITFLPHLYYCINFVFGLPVVIYFVWIKFIFN